MNAPKKRPMIQVLIIEDDVKIAEINRRFVEKVPGYQVIGIATDEPQAKEQLEVLQPDLVLLDLYFPDMNGLDMLRFINESHPETNVIMITAGKEVESVKNAIRYGVFDFIVKPVVFERFQATLLQFQEYHRKFADLSSQQKLINQEEIDQLLEGVRSRVSQDKGAVLPKGIDHLTLKKMRHVIENDANGMTAEQAGVLIGASRTTARRYLEYLVSQGEAMADLSYGVVGRPERVYRNAGKQ